MNVTYSKNKKAYHDYEMIQSYEAGMVLNSAQVKSIRASTVNLLGSYASVDDGKIVLKQAHISKPDNVHHVKNFDEHAHIFLKISKKELREIHKAVKEKNTTLIVSEIYQRENTKFIKCKLNIARGKRDYDKREALKRKSQEMDAKRELKDY